MPAELKAETERNRREALSEGVIRRLKLNNKLVVQANGEEKRRQKGSAIGGLEGLEGCFIFYWERMVGCIAGEQI